MPSIELPTISTDLERPRATLCAGGVWGLENAAEFHRAALELLPSGKDVRLDWSGAVQIDASILQIVMALRQDLAAAGRSFSVGKPSDEVADYLRIAGFPWLVEGDGGR
jgi:anti-anti-sigma regulatory factor